MLPQPTTATPSFSLAARALRIFGTPKSWAPAAAPASAALCLRKRRRLVLVLVLMVLSLSEKRNAVFAVVRGRGGNAAFSQSFPDECPLGFDSRGSRYRRER